MLPRFRIIKLCHINSFADLQSSLGSPLFQSPQLPKSGIAVQTIGIKTGKGIQDLKIEKLMCSTYMLEVQPFLKDLLKNRT